MTTVRSFAQLAADDPTIHEHALESPSPRGAKLSLIHI